MLVADLRHFLDMPPDGEGPARRMGEYLSLIVCAATAGDAGRSWVTALTCRRRPDRRACPGPLAVIRTDIPTSIGWECTSCGDDGVITGWEGSPFDLRMRGADTRPRVPISIAVPTDVVATLHDLVVIDIRVERLVFGATVSGGRAELAGDEADLEELVAAVAAEANHAEDRRRQKRLDAAHDALADALERATRV